VKAKQRSEVVLYIGDVHASTRPVIVKTLLGSCIAACLWDPAAAVGGMNHFMLPRVQGEGAEESSRFGVHAMDLLIGQIMKAGGDRRRLRAKVFGGGHVLGLPDGRDSVPRQNISFILEFCRAEGFDIVAQDLGGRTARQVRFETGSGRAWVRRLRSAPAGVVEAEAPLMGAPAPAYGEVTLF
jgi:chemotaxis receptor (MCP) glutamine deamidase CheD